MRIKNIIRKATVAALTAVMILAPIVNVKAALSDVIDTSKTGSLTIHKYDMTAAKQAGVNLDQFTSTGKQDTNAEQALKKYAIKGVEFGIGFKNAEVLGHEAHDEIYLDKKKGFMRRTNRAGGLEGGMTTGMPLIMTAAMKPIPTQIDPLNTVNIDTLEVDKASTERSDVCAVPAASVVAEAEVAFVIAQAYLDKFGSDNMTDIKANIESFKKRIKTMSR